MSPHRVSQPVRTRFGPAVLLLTALLWFTVPQAGAVDPTPATTPGTVPGVTVDTDPLRSLVLLDVSGSMARDGGHGSSLLDGARRALTELAYSLPRGTQLGLRAYGSDYPGTDRARSCTDTRLLMPLSPLNAEQMVAAAKPLVPTGDTPIAHALQQASKDFGARTGARDTIVLISDGEDNCSPQPPCTVVQQLKEQGFRVRVQTVGVALAGGSRAQQELQCIARVSGGSYYSATDSDALSAALDRIAQQSRGRLGGGEPIVAQTSEMTPQAIEPGNYRVRIKPGEALWYRFDAPEGALPRILGTIQGARGRKTLPAELDGCEAWRIELRNRAGEGRVYPPYGNSGVFAGREFGSTGASTSDALSATTTGIDYPGPWVVRLSLGIDPNGKPMACAKDLPVTGYPVRFSLAFGGPTSAPEQTTAPSEGVSPTPTPGPVTTAPTVLDPDEPDATAKYGEAVHPDRGGDWTAPFSAVLVAVGVLGLGGVLFRIRQRRTRGW